MTLQGLCSTQPKIFPVTTDRKVLRTHHRACQKGKPNLSEESQVVWKYFDL